MDDLKTLGASVGVFIAAIAVCLAISFVVHFISDPIAVAIVSMSPLVGIGSAVGYFKDRMAKKKDQV